MRFWIRVCRPCAGPLNVVPDQSNQNRHQRAGQFADDQSMRAFRLSAWPCSTFQSKQILH
jgi:hypothetical protein